MLRCDCYTGCDCHFWCCTNCRCKLVCSVRRWGNPAFLGLSQRHRNRTDRFDSIFLQINSTITKHYIAPPPLLPLYLSKHSKSPRLHCALVWSSSECMYWKGTHWQSASILLSLQPSMQSLKLYFPKTVFFSEGNMHCLCCTEYFSISLVASSFIASKRTYFSTPNGIISSMKPPDVESG